MMLTPEYKQQLIKLHAQQIWGNQGWKALPDVLRLILEYRLREPTVLDFGAGERTLELAAQWALPHVSVTSYDPGIHGIDELPIGEHDIVVCTDVMEHVEEDYVDLTLETLRAYSTKAAYFVIATGPAKTKLPDGRNAHVTIKPRDWWRAKIAKHWRELEEVEGKNYRVIARV